VTSEVDLKRVRVKKERRVVVYAELWATSDFLLKQAHAVPVGRYHVLLASLVLRAFALEAFLNHVGESLFTCWNDLQFLGPRRKVNVICERIGLKPDWGSQPWQTANDILSFRNTVAHGKNESRSCGREFLNKDNYETFINQALLAKWQEDITVEYADKFCAQLKRLFELFHAKANIPDDGLFNRGTQVGSAEVGSKFAPS